MSYRRQHGDGRCGHRKRRKKPVACPATSVTDPCSPSTLLETRIEQCDQMSTASLRELVRECGLPENTVYQIPLLTRALKRLLGGRDPRYQQVRAVRRLVYGIGDTILVAKTGFGKSIALHAYSVLTGNITLQIIPLSKLGNEQLEAIRRYDGAFPCLVTAETKDENPRLFQEIRQLKYTHILLGPEQAVSPAFQGLFLDPTFRSRVQLVAIDECHVIHQWRDFRSEYLCFHELRRMLSSTAVFFACTTTFDVTTEEAVVSYGGFKKIGSYDGADNNGCLEIIRTSVDRPEIAICIVPIEQGGQGSYSQILGCVDAGFGSEAAPIDPMRIAKTAYTYTWRASSAIALIVLLIILYESHIPRPDNVLITRRFVPLLCRYIPSIFSR